MNFLAIIATTLLSLQINSFYSPIKKCAGIMEENDLYVPVDPSRTIAEVEFNSSLDRIQKVFGPQISKLGGKLIINRLWTDGTVNASAEQYGKNYVLNMYGGLARHPLINNDTFLVVACHEIGHHLGGAPKLQFFSSWATNEGQADYFAALKCFRQVFSEQENLDWLNSNTAHPKIDSDCKITWSKESDQAACIRFSTAAFQLATLFKQAKYPNETLAADETDNRFVSKTFDGHPKPQCRFDTYFSGSKCTVDLNSALDDIDYKIGTCTPATGFQIGHRPRCWFADELSTAPNNF